jgi:hypothetical protein
LLDLTGVTPAKAFRDSYPARVLFRPAAPVISVRIDFAAQAKHDAAATVATAALRSE